ncbi:MAG: DUF5675 family protein [Prevotellaceae bacterium]|jgi:hypothetical protein|nr:DUF5675 family protein [Prevotellaceae bacterium]
MELTLKRRFLKETYTIGSLYIDGEYFCDTLEDADCGLTKAMSLDEIRQRKVAHETAIPTGEYTVVVVRSPAKKRALPRLLNVPGFGGVLLHRGNTAHDTSGCILLGENKEPGKVVRSTLYEQRLIAILTAAQERNEEISIKIMNDKK